MKNLEKHNNKRKQNKKTTKSQILAKNNLVFFVEYILGLQILHMNHQRYVVIKYGSNSDSMKSFRSKIYQKNPEKIFQFPNEKYRRNKKAASLSFSITSFVYKLFRKNEDSMKKISRFQQTTQKMYRSFVFSGKTSFQFTCFFLYQIRQIKLVLLVL